MAGGARERVERSARCTVAMAPATADKIAHRALEKGDVLAVARLAAIQAAKRAAEFAGGAALVGAVDVDAAVGEASVDLRVTVASRTDTSPDAEALFACLVGALTIYDMCKAVDRGMLIGALELEEALT